ncbi:MAG: outer membrane protein transport protein [Candidatus Saccharicenans sp.]
MKKKTGKIFCLIILFPILWASGLAQSGPGQYTEEAPLGSWNILGPETAAILGTGFCQIARVASSSAVFSNPALLSLLPATDFSLTPSFNQTQLFRYWLVNTGVVATSGNLTYRNWQVDHFGLSHRLGRWTLGLGAALSENYGRPGLEYRYVYNQQVYNQLQIWQSGYLTSYGLSLARPLNQHLSLGLSLVYEHGHLERSLDEFWFQEEIQMIDYRHQEITGFRMLAGLSYCLNGRLFFGLSLSPPYTRRVKGQSSLKYISSATEIETRGQASDRIRRPLILGLGSWLIINQNLEGYLEAAFFNWTKYSFTYYGEGQVRNFRDTIRIGAGLQYQGKLRFLGRPLSTPYFLGLAVDPQPTAEYKSTYLFLTFGSGIGNEIFRLSFSSALGLESGSGQKLKRQKIAVTLDVYPGPKKNRAKMR